MIDCSHKEGEMSCSVASRQPRHIAIRMFAELLGGLDEVAEVYAAEADRRRVAGLGCEAAYTDAQGR